jgi:hypothetical protein
MTKKPCSDCGVEKDLSSFYKRKDSIDGYRNNCKDCHYLKNKSGIKKYQSKDSSKQKAKINNHDYWINNKEELSLKKKIYREINKDKLSKQKSEYYKNNKEIILKKNIERNKLYLTTNSLFKLKENIRGLIRNSIKRKGFIKSKRTESIIGISIIEFIEYIESKFETWMSWENYGKYNGELNYGWDIDHIIPTSTAKTEEEIYNLNYYTNLQPLCSKINRDIKKHKLKNPQF